MALPMIDLHESLRWRYAVKKYDNEGQLSADELGALRGALRMAPSSFGLQPYRALFIEDRAVRSQLRAASFDQPQVSEASCLVVLAIETCIDEAFVRRHFETIARVSQLPLSERMARHQQSVLRSIQRMTEDTKRAWAGHQAYLALGFLLFAAAQLGIDANPMEGFVAARYDQLLGLSERSLSAVVIAGLGRRSPDDRFQHFPKVRRPADELFLNVPAVQS